MEDPIATHSCQALAKEITQLSAQMNVATSRLLKMINEFDEDEGWQGWASCAHWLNWACGWSLRMAREKLRVAKALKDCPKIAQAFEQGEISFSKVRAMTRVATPATEEYLLQIARHGTASQMEKLVRHYRGVIRENALEDAKKQYEHRELTFYYEDDNTMVIKVRLPAEQGELVLNALDQLVEKEFGKEGLKVWDGSAEPSPEEYKPTLSQKRADEFVFLASQSLGLGAEQSGSKYQVVVHVDEAVLEKDEVGLCELENGPTLANETAKRLSCDADVVKVIEDEFGEPINIGRKQRSLTTALARALRIRDQGCRFPGCNHKKYLEAHHIQHWANGGETSIENLVQLCHFHHRLVHEGQWNVARIGPNQFEFISPDGRTVPNCHPGSIVDADEYKKGVASVAVDSGKQTRWDGTHADYGEMVRQLECYEAANSVRPDTITNKRS